MFTAVSCPHCAGRIGIDASSAAHDAICSLCGKQFQVPPIALPVAAATGSGALAGNPSISNTQSVEPVVKWVVAGVFAIIVAAMVHSCKQESPKLRGRAAKKSDDLAAIIDQQFSQPSKGTAEPEPAAEAPLQPDRAYTSDTITTPAYKSDAHTATLVAGDGVFIAADEDAYSRVTKLSVARDADGIRDLMLESRVWSVSGNVQVRILDRGFFCTEIRILDGPMAGRSGFVATEWLK